MFPKLVAVLWKVSAGSDKKVICDSSNGVLVKDAYNEEDVNRLASDYVRRYSTQPRFDSVVVFTPTQAAVPVPIELKPITVNEVAK